MHILTTGNHINRVLEIGKNWTWQKPTFSLISRNHTTYGGHPLISNLESSKLILGPTKLLKLPDYFCSPKMKKVS